MTPPLVDHLENHLGPLSSGFADASGEASSFQVALFQRGPMPGVDVLATLGFSHHVLRVGDGVRRVREELVIMLRDRNGPGVWPAILQQVAREAIRKDKALVPGDVVGPRDRLTADATVSALYVAVPVYLPDSFHVCYSTPEPIVFGWLVPITEDEARFVRERGRDAFEERLTSSDPDVLDLRRPSIV